MATITLEIGGWVGPRNLYSHCIADIATSGNIKSACNKRFGPTAVVMENGTENHLSRCKRCVEVMDAEELPALEIPAVGAAASKRKAAPATSDPVRDDLNKRINAAVVERDAALTAVVKAANKVEKASAETAPTRELRKLVRSADDGTPLIAGPAASGHYLMYPDTTDHYRSICGKVSVPDMPGIKDKLCGRCAKLVTHEELVTETARIAGEIESEQKAAEVKENAPVPVPEATPEPVKAPKPSESVTDAQHKEAVRAAKTNKEAARNKADIASAPVKCSVHGRAKVKPVEGTDSDGIKGQCPTCRTFTDLSAKGYIGTHNVGNAPAPVSGALSERTVPPVATGNTHGATADAEKAVAKSVKAVSKAIAKGKEAEIPTASHAPTGSGAAPMLDGVATLPRGKMGTAGVRFDAEITETATVGGRYGYLTSNEYEAMIAGQGGTSRKRNYWRKVKANKDAAKRIRQALSSKSQGTGGRAH